MYARIAKSALVKSLRINDQIHDTPTWRASLLSTHMRLVALVIALLLALSPAAASAARQQMFGLLFPELPPYDAPDDTALAALTAAGTTAAPGPLFDENLAADDNPDNLPAFFTYFGQFLDHDMTLDTLPLPTEFVDPNTILNNRDQRLNLDSVFGLRRKLRPELYEADGKRVKVNDRDLPRNPDGSAIIGDGRNDENQVIAQIHVAFLRAYNRLLDQGFKPAKARDLMEYRHQWIVVHEFLLDVLDPDVYADVFRPNGSIHTRYYDPKKAVKADMPVEFSVAAYRFGHSMVRKAYSIVEGTLAVPPPKVQVFSATADDLRGGRPIAANHVIFWPNFLNVDGVPPTGGANGLPLNISRKIDTLLSSGLFTLPIPGAAASGSSILAQRNIQRAREYGLPSGQAVAARLGITALTNANIAAQIPRLAVLLDPAYLDQAPLWLYILVESQIVHNGAKLGPVGSRIVAEVIGGLLAADKNSYYRKGWTPDGGVFRAQDLLREAGVLPPLP